MSARKQAGRLRAIIARRLRAVRVADAMADALIANDNVVTGNLVDAILSTDTNRVFNISYRIDKRYDMMLLDSIYIDLTRYLSSADYGRYLYDEYDGEYQEVNQGDIAWWIEQKIQTPYWNSIYGTDFFVKSKGKGYFYPLSDPKYRDALAFLITRGLKERDGRPKRQTDFFQEALLSAEAAIIEAKEDFYDEWSIELVNNIDEDINTIFQ